MVLYTIIFTFEKNYLFEKCKTIIFLYTGYKKIYMKNFIYSMLLVICMMYSCSESKQRNNTNEKPNQESKTASPYEVNENGFSVVFPSKPVVNAITTDSEFGQRQVLYYTLDNQTEKYHLIYSDYPEVMLELGNPQEIIDGVIANILFETKATEKGREEYLVDSLKGTLVNAEADNVSIKAGVIFISNRLYQLVYMNENKDSLVKGDDFFKSFKPAN
ncbi:MAG: hypothetical protein A2W91_11320 [Bacteroidetes bacterium GWF2_38_335]|nr:MAG: hypothetical protein A2W91_11320 [Bacteroidetes bacterium GWF2_38_335]OFY81713.1 MAG: hypothetical protein A2281_05720 [Bacteroidetes bacterium RIFOXYA12_FULL_38_20]HBS87777.1 hypothetical protein [Bacteroidales bacterium]